MNRTTPIPVGADCRAVADVLSRVGDKWTILVILTLREGPRRFSALRRDIAGVSQQMLTSTLKALERDGLVVRTVLASAPPQVTYTLSKLGSSLVTAVHQLADWSVMNIESIQAHRETYDQQRLSRTQDDTSS